MNPCWITTGGKAHKLALKGYDSDFLLPVSPPCPRLNQLVVLLQGQRGRLSSQPVLDNRREEVEEEMEMEEGDAEGEGPMAVREGPSGHGLQQDDNNSARTTNTTTTNLLASVKEQVRGWSCCSHTHDAGVWSFFISSCLCFFY